MTSSRRLWHRLQSPRLALWLIGALAVFVLVSFLVPQRSILTVAEYEAWALANPVIAAASEALGFDVVFSSWLFAIVLALLAVNLTACTYGRIIRGRSYPPRTPATAPPNAHALQLENGDPPVGLADVATGGWRLDQPAEGTWLFWRGQTGRGGSILLHLGLLLLMLGGIASSMTRFSGSMVLAEGQDLVDAPGAYVEIRESPRFGTAFTGAQLGMESIEFAYEGDVITDAVARMRYAGRDGIGRLKDVRVNYPLHLEGKAYLLEKAGHAVAVRIVDPSGQERLSSIVNLGETGSDGSSDVIDMGDATARLTLIADRRFEGGADPRKFELNDPVLYVALEAPDANGESALLPGASGAIDGWTIEFAGVRLWNRFMVRADGGRWLSFVAFGLVIVGMAVRWLDPDAVVILRNDQGRWLLWGRSRQGDLAVSRQLRRVRHTLAERSEPSEVDQ